MTQPGPSTNTGPEFVREMARSFWYSAILRAAIKLDVFALLEDRALTYQEVADSLGASPRYTQAFLDCCVVLELLEESTGKFTNSSNASSFLVKGKDSYVGDHALHHTNTWVSWGRLDEVIKDGKIILPFETGFVDPDTYWTNYMTGQHNRATRVNPVNWSRTSIFETNEISSTWAAAPPATVSPSVKPTGSLRQWLSIRKSR